MIWYIPETILQTGVIFNCCLIHSSIFDDLLERSFFFLNWARLCVSYICMYGMCMRDVCVCVIHPCVCTCVCAGALNLHMLIQRPEINSGGSFCLFVFYLSHCTFFFEACSVTKPEAHLFYWNWLASEFQGSSRLHPHHTPAQEGLRIQSQVLFVCKQFTYWVSSQPWNVFMICMHLLVMRHCAKALRSTMPTALGLFPTVLYVLPQSQDGCPL